MSPVSLPKPTSPMAVSTPVIPCGISRQKSKDSARYVNLIASKIHGLIKTNDNFRQFMEGKISNMVNVFFFITKTKN